jgi:predicted RNA-binding protein with PUA-like domain
MAQSWILKSEPSTYSWDELVNEGKAVWDGVANAAALIHLRTMAVGDELLIYHSGEGKEIVGIAEVTRAAYPDPKLNDPKRVVIEIEPVRPLKTPVTLGTIKADRSLAQLALVRISRLSVSPVSAEHRAILRKLGVR